MARYIDADALIERLKFKRDTDNIDRNKYAGLECAIAQCKKASTADVVPKSEVDNLKVLLEMQEKAYESLKELYDMDTEALIKAREKTEIEVVREILEEIERLIELYTVNTPIHMPFNYIDVLFAHFVAELKKKYTED